MVVCKQHSKQSTHQMPLTAVRHSLPSGGDISMCMCLTTCSTVYMHLRVMMTVGIFSIKTRNSTMPTRTRKRGSV